MLNHITLTVKNLMQSKEFYTQALAPLGITALFAEEHAYAGFGKEKPFFWISAEDEKHPLSKNIHVAFQANNKEEVIAFYNAAMSAGAQDNGTPGPRPEYHEHYFAAFVLDPDGNNIEAVFGNN